MTRAIGRKDCVNCGDPFRGAGTLCPDCVPRGAARAPAHQLCPYCRAMVTWETLGRVARRIDGWVEALYYCRGCGATFEFAAWIDEKSARGRA